MAGYSGTPIVKKLGIKPGHRLALVNSPAGFGYANLPEDVELKRDLRGSRKFDVIHFFSKRRGELEKKAARLAARIEYDGALWISWPKKSAGVRTDLTENIVRQIGLAAGLVDVKICAVDETWSGLRFVYRLKDRPKTRKHDR